MRKPAAIALPEAERARLNGVWEASRPKLLAFVQWRLDPALRPRLDAADILSEAFADAVKRWPEFQPEQWTTAYAWLYGIVRDRLIETWRYHARSVRDPRRQMSWPEHSSMQLGLRLIARGPGPESEALRAERSRLVHEALAQLPETDRELLAMRYFDELSFADAARILNISEGNANVRHLRALRKFRTLWLASYSGEESRS